MSIHFHLRYSTRFGQDLFVIIEAGQDGAEQAAEYPMTYLNDELWQCSVDVGHAPQVLFYRFEMREQSGEIKEDWGRRRLDYSGKNDLRVFDYWNVPGAVENAFETQAFRVLEPVAEAKEAIAKKGFTHYFRVKAPLLRKEEVLCMVGHGIALRNWDTKAPLLLRRDGEGWFLQLDLSGENFPLGYKYGVWNTRTNQFMGFEGGSNRTLYAAATGTREPALTILNDGFARFPAPTWRGAGVAIPVFSLRSKKSWGVGEFSDILLLVDWAKSVGLKIIQLLPVNDTTATHTWVDSYPYSAVSAFALHPIYLNMEQLAGKKHAALLKPYQKTQKTLNALEAVDYEAVMKLKWEIIRQLYQLQKDEWAGDKAYQTYFSENRHWLGPYAAFCSLRDANGTADFSKWPSQKVCQPAEVEKMLSPASKNYDEVAIHLFVQWHLHLQLKAATDYAHEHGIAVKGDIPIGIYRHSCDAWVAPELYNMNMQAGAPPDDFAVNGQNWGFPTYNWAQMQADGFAWWRQRFHQMSLYFDAFRIDHILGFFRIWSIPMDAVEGILGHFVPAIPVTEAELLENGVGFDRDRLCRPYITEQVLHDIFGADINWVGENCLLPRKDDRFDLRPEFATQRLVEQYFEGQPGTGQHIRLRDGLYRLIANVILLEGGAEENGALHFRFGMEKTTSFQYLPEAVKGPLKALYVDYFYRRQDDFWQREAMEKLPALKRATKMLICGEDLGMVPHCVPDVMKELGILSLEIQRMPKATGATFFHPKDAPYMSVVTPSTHDMSTIRGWWEEDHDLSQRFFREILGLEGSAPYFCEPWLNRAILEQHFQSPAMWSIFQLQDLLGMDEKLRRENPHDERINIPANPKHYWRYRVHIMLEDLMKSGEFNAALKKMIAGSGRA